MCICGLRCVSWSPQPLIALGCAVVQVRGRRRNLHDRGCNAERLGASERHEPFPWSELREGIRRVLSNEGRK